MKEDDFLTLLDKFPTVLSMGKTYDVDAPFGWQPIVLSLLGQLEEHAKKAMPDLEVIQIKQVPGVEVKPVAP